MLSQRKLTWRIRGPIAQRNGAPRSKGSRSREVTNSDEIAVFYNQSPQMALLIRRLVMTRHSFEQDEGQFVPLGCIYMASP